MELAEGYEVIESVAVEMDPVLDGFAGVHFELVFDGERYVLPIPLSDRDFVIRHVVRWDEVPDPGAAIGAGPSPVAHATLCFVWASASRLPASTGAGGFRVADGTFFLGSWGL